MLIKEKGFQKKWKPFLIIEIKCYKSNLIPCANGRLVV